MQRFKLTLEYDGRPFVGWQRQREGLSVQACLEEASAGFEGGVVRAVTGAGRTDAGVHATGQVAHIDIDRPMSGDQLQAALNHYVRPHPIAVLAAEPVSDDFHARFSATSRHYRYVMVNRRAPLSFEAGLAWQIAAPLDADAMHAAAQHLVGRHDFTTFRHSQCQAKSPLKTLDYLTVVREGDHIEVRTGARSFLHSQVRSMVGCLALVGRGQWTGDDLKAALDAADRTRLGFNAPPDGLYLAAVGYSADAAARRPVDQAG